MIDEPDWAPDKMNNCVVVGGVLFLVLWDWSFMPLAQYVPTLQSIEDTLYTLVED